MNSRELGKRIRHERERLELDRKAFAQQVGIDERLVFDIEEGHAEMSEEVLRRICALTEMEEDVLLGKTQPKINPIAVKVGPSINVNQETSMFVNARNKFRAEMFVDILTGEKAAEEEEDARKK